MAAFKERPTDLQNHDYPKITIFSDWCKRCGICVAFCPKKVLAMDQDRKVYVQSRENCIACHMCELRCPDFAINVEEGRTISATGEKGA